MCGIFGAFGPAHEDRVSDGLNLIRHRGPDGQGIRRHGQAVHGHARLAMVDATAASAQPMSVGRTTVSFVGEVWGWWGIRAGMEAAGRRFRTRGDTEVLAALLDRSGPAGLPAAGDSMFAVAWTGPDGTFLARDDLGEVPLYAVRSAGGFEWASERKAWGRAGGRASPVPPGGLIHLETGRMSSWVLPGGGVDDLGGVESATPETVLKDLTEGVRRRLEADAEVCVLLSGGLDSSLTTLLAARERRVVAFHAFLDPASADLRAARRLAAELDVDLEEVRLEAPTAESLSAAALAIELESKAQVEIAHACIPLARAVRAAGFRGCLSGEAADELFGGYGNSIVAAAGLDDAGWRNHRRGLFAKMARGNFVRTNKAFMAAGVECRLPFVERSLVRSVLACGKRFCPPGKGLLQEAARLAGLPEWIVDREKDTFQGGSGVAAAAATAVRDPARFYRAEIVRTFGRRTEG